MLEKSSTIRRNAEDNINAESRWVFTIKFFQLFCMSEISQNVGVKVILRKNIYVHRYSLQHLSLWQKKNRSHLKQEQLNKHSMVHP